VQRAVEALRRQVRGRARRLRVLDRARELIEAGRYVAALDVRDVPQRGHEAGERVRVVRDQFCAAAGAVMTRDDQRTLRRARTLNSLLDRPHVRHPDAPASERRRTTDMPARVHSINEHNPPTPHLLTQSINTTHPHLISSCAARSASTS
jgi:hypothetical protein